MITIAVTGGIGSGKSTVCRSFRSMRVPVLSADDLSKQIANEVPAVRKKIVALLGPHAYAPDRSLDRSYVAQKVFSNARLRRSLEQILHPAVLRRVRAWFGEQQKKGKRIAAVEAALVFESGLDKLVDMVVVVDAAKAERVRRIQARDGLSKAEIRRRMDAQMPDRERLKKADVILRNSGQKKALIRRSQFLIQVLRKLIS